MVGISTAAPRKSARERRTRGRSCGQATGEKPPLATQQAEPPSFLCPLQHSFCPAVVPLGTQSDASLAAPTFPHSPGGGSLPGLDGQDFNFNLCRTLITWGGGEMSAECSHIWTRQTSAGEPALLP